MKYKPSFSRLCSSLHFHAGASHDRKQRRRHQGMFFCLLETLTPASPQQIGMAHSQMRFLLAAWGEKKKGHPLQLFYMTHRVITSLLTYLPFNQLQGPGRGVGACQCVCVFAHVCQFDLHRGCISLLVPLHLCTKIKIPCCFSVAYGISLTTNLLTHETCPYLACTVNQRLLLSLICMHWV